MTFMRHLWLSVIFGWSMMIVSVVTFAREPFEDVCHASIKMGPGAGQDGRPVAVLYVMDGDRLGSLVSAMCSYLSSGKGATSACVVVAVETQDRTTNFTPTQSQFGRDGQVIAGPAIGGGARQMAECLLTQVKPEISKRLLDVPLKHVLMGHSFGGLFTLWTMTEHPTAFDAWVAADPSLWWDRGILIKELQKNRGTHGPHWVYTGFASALKNQKTTAAWNLKKLSDFREALTTKRQPPTETVIQMYSDETHGTIAVPVFYDALKRLLVNRPSV